MPRECSRPCPQVPRASRNSSSFISDYVFDEAVTVISVRTRNHELAERLGTALRESKVIRMLRVDESAFEAAWNEFAVMKGSGMSFTDCTSIALMRRHGIGAIFSFDRHFIAYREFMVVQDKETATTG